MNRIAIATLAAVSWLQAGNWTAPVEVHHDTTRCLTYRAKLSGQYLAIEVKLEPGWHTFAIDNKQRAEEKLAGKMSLGLDQPTEIKLLKGLELNGPWLQSPPKDFSKPELRWFAFGFDNAAVFAAKVRRLTAGPAEIAIRGQVCTDKICKNVDVDISLPVTPADSSAADIDVRGLTAVK